MPKFHSTGYFFEEISMKMKLVTSCFVMGALLAPVVGHTADADMDTDRSHPKTFIKDSVITTKVKAKLAAEKMSTMTRIRVDTDQNGVVWLSGNAKSKEEADKAVAIATGVEGVTSVRDEIKIQKGD